MQSVCLAGLRPWVQSLAANNNKDQRKIFNKSVASIGRTVFLVERPVLQFEVQCKLPLKLTCISGTSKFSFPINFFPMRHLESA